MHLHYLDEGNAYENQLDMLFPMCPWGIALLNQMRLKQFVLYYNKFVVPMLQFNEGMVKRNQIQYDIIP